MPSIDDVYGSDETLRANHLPPGQSVPVTIAAVLPKRFDDGGKLELKFAGKQRVLLANKTNAGLISRFLNERDYTRWVGQTIWLKASETEFKGNLVPCVRVDLHPPQAAAAAVTARIGDENNCSQSPANEAQARELSKAPAEQQAPAPHSAPRGEVTYVPDNPADPGGYRAETATLSAAPAADIPF